jgi:hypothetical protein
MSDWISTADVAQDPQRVRQIQLLGDLLNSLRFARTPTSSEDLSASPPEYHHGSKAFNANPEPYADPNIDTIRGRGRVGKLQNVDKQNDSTTPPGRMFVLPRHSILLSIVIRFVVIRSLTRISCVSHDVEIMPAVCQWQGCTYSGCFQRQGELLGHVKRVHIYPGSFPCPIEGCYSSFNRRDNLQVHLNRTHRP